MMYSLLKSLIEFKSKLARELKTLDVCVCS